MGAAQSTEPESYVLSLLAEGRCEPAFAAAQESGAPEAHAPHLANLGRRLWRQGHIAEAVGALEKSLALDAGLAAPWLTLGMVKLSQGALEEGDRLLQEALARKPELATGHYLRGVVAARRGERERAVEHLVRCLELRPGHRECAAQLRQLLEGLPCDRGVQGRAREALAGAERSPAGDAGPTLSVCLIVRDEEDSLARCLESVREIADEVIVVDTGSRDGTVDVARRFGAEVHEFEWCDDFAAARNAAIAKANSNWILIVDADEEMPRESGEQIQELLRAGVPGPVCQVTTLVPTRGPGRYASCLAGHLRLFRNGLGFRFEGAVHEQLVDEGGRPVERVVFTGIPVLHHGYLESEDALDERAQRNVRLLAARAAAEPDNPVVLFYLGAARLGQGDVEAAVDDLTRALEEMRSAGALHKKVAVLLAEALGVAERAPQAEAVLRESLEGRPEDPELLCALGNLLEERGRTDEAVEVYRAATRGRFGPEIDYHDFTCRDAKPRGRLAAIYLAHGRAEEAMRELRPALEVRPEAAHLRCLLAAALIRVGRHEEAQGELDVVLAEHPDDARAHDMLGVVHALQEQAQEAAREFELSLALKPGEVDTLCNLAQARQALGELDRARAAWEAALKENACHVPAWLGLARNYWESGVYAASAQCYEMAARHSRGAPDVMGEIAAARAALVRLTNQPERGGAE